MYNLRKGKKSFQIKVNLICCGSHHAIVILLRFEFWAEGWHEKIYFLMSRNWSNKCDGSMAPAASRFARMIFYRQISCVGFLRAERAGEAHFRPLLILIQSLPWEEHKVQQFRRKFNDRTNQGINHDEIVINGRRQPNNGGEET